MAKTIKKPLQRQKESSEISQANSESSLKSEYAKQFYWVIGVLASLVLIFFVSYTYFQSLSHFSYQGLSFTKEKLGSIPIYHYYYYFLSETGSQKQFNLYLREDPRNNPVMVEGEIFFPKNNQIHISISPEDFKSCSWTVGAYASLASFLIGHEYKVISGTPKESEAYSMNSTYTNCYTHPKDAVILIELGNESKITKENSCYRLEVNQCDILSVVEKFMTQSLIDSRNSAIKSNTLVTITPKKPENTLNLPTNYTA